MIDDDRDERHQKCPEITYMAMGFQPHSVPVGGMHMHVKGNGRLLNSVAVSR